MTSQATKSGKAIFSQGHKVIDLGVIRKGFISGVCMPNIGQKEYAPSYGFGTQKSAENLKKKLIR